MNQDERKTAREPVKIRNRDIPLLSRVLYIMQGVSATEQLRSWQQDRLWNITQKITGLPGGGGVPGGYEKNFSAIGEIEEKFASQCEEYTQEMQEAEAILNAIQSETMRIFVIMKYVLHMPDRRIMRELNIRRWKLDKMSRAIEEAESMDKVVWNERYALK
ncbi:MAG: hypothetical protein IJP78_07775 [Clostridia bacterium]|nr:hypothetical protein [Clostridia bacterium]